MYLTVQEFADLMKVTRQCVYNWLAEGMPLEIKHPPRIKQDDAVQWLKGR